MPADLRPPRRGRARQTCFVGRRPYEAPEVYAVTDDDVRRLRPNRPGSPLAICGLDLSTYRGHHPSRVPPVVLGHEAAGEVDAVGPDLEGPTRGMRVAVEPLLPCRSCVPCRRGETNLCADRRVPGVGRQP
jgi:hypothetical protein